MKGGCPAGMAILHQQQHATAPVKPKVLLEIPAATLEELQQLHMGDNPVSTGSILSIWLNC